MERKIIIVDQATAVGWEEVLKAVGAVQRQLNEHFGPAWGISQALGLLGPGEPIPPGQWVHYLFDDADQAGALGYHDLTDQGLPSGITFVKTTLDAGLPWQPTFSHEVLELAADPFCFSLVRNPYTNQDEWLEVGDPVEAGSYEIDGVAVSDFVLPGWFGATSPNLPFNYLDTVSEPFKLAPGGYKGIVRPDGTVTQVVARRDVKAAEPREVPQKWSRRWRRLRGCRALEHSIIGGKK